MGSGQVLVGVLGSVGRLELCCWDVVEVAVQPFGVAPVDPGEGGELDVVDRGPRALVGPADEFGLVEPVDGLGQGVVVAVADHPDRGDGVDLGEAFAVADAGELLRLKESSQHCLVGSTA